MNTNTALFMSIINKLFNERELSKILYSFYSYNHNIDNTGKIIYIELKNKITYKGVILPNAFNKYYEKTIIVALPNGRCDILIKADNNHFIIFTNKPNIKASSASSFACFANFYIVA